VNIEASLISKIKTKEDFLKVLDERITEEFFEEYKDVFSTISVHYRKYKTVPERETLEKAFPNFEFQENGEPLEFFIDKIKEQYKRKLYVSKLPKVAELLPKDVNEAEKLLQGILLESKSKVKTGSLLDSRTGADTRIQLYEQRAATLGIDGYTTSWPYLDNLTCGFHPGELIILMGKPKTAKSWLLTWMFHNAWIEHNVPVLFITKEMSPLAIQWRFDAIDCRLPYESIRHGLLTEQQKNKYFARIKEIEEKTKSGELAPYVIKGFELTDGSAGVSSIIPHVERYLGNGGLLFVDGMYLIPDDRGDTEWRGIVNVATDLKILAQTYNIPVIATTQQSLEDKSDVPRLENAAYGKYIVQYADLILGIGRTDIDRETNRATIYILGQREGDVGNFVINTQFDPVDFSQATEKFVIDDTEDEEEFNI